MSQSGKVDEQSMEEILASIRSSVDTSEVAPPPPTGQTLGEARSIGAAKTGAGADGVSAPTPSVPVPEGSGRLQDALSQVRAPQFDARSPGMAGEMPAQPASQAPSPPAPAKLADLPKTEKTAAPPVAPARMRDEDLSDLFVDDPASGRAPAPEVAKAGGEGKPQPPVPGVPFGSKPVTAPAPAETEKPASVASQIAAATAPSQPPTAMPQAAAPASSPAPSSSDAVSSDPGSAGENKAAAPLSAQEGVEVATASAKRSPNFDALKTLAGVPTSEDSDNASQESASASSVLATPDPAPKASDTREASASNPVVEMHSMAAAMSSETKSSEEKSSEASAPPTVSAQDIGVAPQPVPSFTSSTTPPSPTPVSDAESAVTSDDVPTEIIMSTASSDAEPEPAKLKSGEDTAVAAEANTAQETNSDAPDTAIAGAATTSSTRSLEDVVVDLLKPQLNAWLEANMPRIVERALREEQLGLADRAADKGSK